MKFLNARRKPQIIKSSHQIEYNGEVIPIALTLSKRRSFSIIVRPNSEVEVKGPLNSNVGKLLKRAEDRAAWIMRHRKKFQDMPHLSVIKKFEAGEEFLYLGERYQLRLNKSAHSRVEINGDHFDIFCKSQSPAVIRTILKFWYMEKGKEIFAARIEVCLEALRHLKLPPHKKIEVKIMKGRWGSCSNNGLIRLNPELIAAPLECIDYVIVHELCHLRQHNHSPRFYKLMTAAMPDWRARKALLNKTVEIRFL